MRSGIIILTLFFLVSGSVNAQSKKKINNSAVIMVRGGDSSHTDKFSVAVYRYWFPKYLPIIVKGTRGANGVCVFEITDIDQPVYINLYKEYFATGVPDALLYQYLIEPGDRVTINISTERSNESLAQPTRKKYQFGFSGNGVAKYICRYEFDSLMAGIPITERVLSNGEEFSQNTLFDKGWIGACQILKRHVKAMSYLSSQVLKIDFFTAIELRRLQALRIVHSGVVRDSMLSTKVAKVYLLKSRKVEQYFNSDAKLIANKYPQFILDKLSIGKYRGSTKKQLGDSYIRPIYEVILKTYKGELRDKVLTFFALNNFETKVGQELFEDILSKVKTKYCYDQLQSFSEANSVGRQAYNFSLPNLNGKIVKLDSLLGKVVFVDFWFNGCSGCLQYYKQVISKVEERFKDNSEVLFVTINIDVDKSRWIKGVNSGDYTSSDMINLNTGGEGINHEVINRYRVTSYPRPLLIDKYGRIFVNNSDDLRNGGVEKLIEMINRALATK